MKTLIYDKKDESCSLYYKKELICTFNLCKVYKGKNSEKYYHIVNKESLLTITSLIKEQWKYVEIQ